MLKTMQDEDEQCPQTFLDGVAETDVVVPACADMLDGDRCSMRYKYALQ